MKRPKIEKDSITELLRANLGVPQLSIELDQPGVDHNWHSCYDTAYDSKCDDVTVAGTEVMAPCVAAADFLQWLRTVRMVDMVYCSGHYLQAMRRDFLSPGPEFCVAGTVSFIIDDIRVTAGQLSADLLERPHEVAMLDFIDPLSSLPKRGFEHSGVARLGDQDSSAMLRSPRIRALGGVHNSAAAADERFREGVSVDVSVNSDSATILVHPSGSHGTGLPCASEAEDLTSHDNAAHARLGNGSAPVEMYTSMDVISQPQQRSGQASVSEQQSKQPLAAAVGRVLNTAKVVFQVSRDNLPQSLEWLDGIYVPIRWSNVLHPAWQITISVPAAVKAVTAEPVAPETCINI